MNAYANSAAVMAATVVNAIEIDFLAVGEKTKSGDAIAIRYGQLGGAHQIMVVDGGCLAAGDRMVDHLKETFGNDVVVTHMVCTHSDGDHASGLRRVIEALPVQNLWVHQPWKHAAALNPFFKGAWTDANLAYHLRHDCFPVISDLCDLAEQYGVTVLEPFAGVEVGPFRVLAPTMQRYLDLVPKMDQTPTSRAQDTGLMEAIMKAMASAVFGTAENWGIETLKDPSENATSIPNETSVVLFGQIADKRVLLTSDAGVGALTEASEVANYLLLNLASPDLVQMPHHGSRHNVGPTILNTILGEKGADSELRGWAVASCAKECAKKPYRSVTNAFRRRGYRSAQTKGSLVNWRTGYDVRPGMSSAEEIPFHPMVED